MRTQDSGTSQGRMRGLSRRRILPVRRHRAGVSLTITSAVALSMGITGTLEAQVVRQGFYVTDGTVRVMALSGSTLYIGGEFTRVGPPTGGGVPIDSTSGIPAAGFPKIVGTVNAVAPDGEGGWYIGGEFKTVGGSSRSNLARVLADNTLAPWNPSADGAVTTLARGATRVYVGGPFTHAGGQARQYLAALDPVTGVATPWDPSPDGPISALLPDDATVYVSGPFTSIGGQLRSGLAAIDPTTGLASSWDPNPDAGVDALALRDSTVYVGGSFTSIGSQPRNFLAALGATSGLATAWNPDLNGFVHCLATGGSSVYASGGFSYVAGGNEINGLGAFDVTTGMPAPWGCGAFANAMVVHGATLYVAGEVAAIGGERRDHLAAVDAATGTLQAWDPNPFGNVLALAASGTHIFAGGDFSGVGGQARAGLAALDVGTGAVTDWAPDVRRGPGLRIRVCALAASASTLYAGGAFTLSIPVPGDTNATRHNLAAFDLATGDATTWNPNANEPWPQLSYPFQTIATLAVAGSTVYVGGRFTHLAGQTRNYIATLDGTTGETTPWNPSANDSITKIVVHGTTVYVAGTFDRIGALTRHGLAALDAAKQDSTDGIVTAWDPDPWPGSHVSESDPGSGILRGAFGPVHDIAAGGTTVYLAGQFEALGGSPAGEGQSRAYLGAVDATTGIPTSWHPWDISDVGPVPGIGLYVSCLAVGGGALYVGGSFQVIGPSMRTNLIALNGTTGLGTVWSPDPNLAVETLLLDGSTVYAGGSFSSIGGQPQSGIAAMGDLSTPTLLSLVSAVFEGGRVRLAWFAADGRGVTATVYRRTPTSGWTAVATIAGDGTGMLIYEDFQVSAATRYGYRLGIPGAGAEQFLGETWVDVPPAIGFALGGLRPNPSPGDLRIALSLPDATPAQLELLDIAGRLLTARDVGSLGAGNHVVSLAGDHALPAGVYLVRLSRAGRSLTARALVIR